MDELILITYEKLKVTAPYGYTVIFVDIAILRIFIFYIYGK